MVFKLLLFVSLIYSTLSEEDVADVARGWGTQYKWLPNIEVAKEVALKENKPLMLIIHKSWCGACKKLKKLFSNDKEILELSEYFVMVNAGDDAKLEGNNYEPDGGYVPRLLFFRPDGTFVEEAINNDGEFKFKYYHYSSDSIIDTMNTVLDLADFWVPKDQEHIVNQKKEDDLIETLMNKDEL